MFWILRHTRLTSAAALFNAVNNNGNGAHGTAGVHGASGGGRPRKGYNVLSSEDADANNANAHTQLIAESGGAAASTDSDSNGTDVDVEDELSEDSDYDESVTCNVCDRAFSTPRQLAHHQQKKRHFGCSACDSLFLSLMALEHHKEEFEHWSGDDSPHDNTESGEETSDDTVTSEELERLL